MGSFSQIPLQAEGPLDFQKKAATLGDLLQEHQLRQAQIQEAAARTADMQVKAQEAQQMQRDTATWTDKFYQNNGDFAKTLADPDVQRIHPTLYGKIADQYQQIRDRAATADKSTLDASIKQHEALGGMLESALALPDEQRVQAWPQIRQNAIQLGYAKPEEIPQTDPGRPWLQTHKYYGMGQENVQRTELAKRTAQEESDKRAADLAHAQAMNPLTERAEAAKATGEELGLTGRIASATLGGAAGSTLGGATAAGTAAPPTPVASPPIAGQGAPAGTNVSGNRFNAQTGPQQAPGMITPGNIDLKNRPVVQNSDGTSSTVLTTTIEENGKTILIPQIVNGKKVSLQDAIKHYHDTGEHMGIFQTEDAAEEYDKNLHNQMGWNGAPGSAQAAWQGSASTSGRVPGWTQDKQDAWDNFRSLVPKGALPYLPPQWSPQAQATAQRLGLTAEQQAVNARERQTGAPKTAAEFAREMTDPTKTPDERQRWKDALSQFEDSSKRTNPAVQNRFDTREFDSWSKKHEDLQQKEQDQWKLAGEYGDTLSAPKDSDVVDPATKKTVTADDPHRAYFQKQYDAARTKAVQLQTQAKGIRQRFGWGEFAPQQGTGAAPAQQPQSAPIQAPPTNVLKEGVARRFKGQRGLWTLQGGKPVNLEQ